MIEKVAMISDVWNDEDVYVKMVVEDNVKKVDFMEEGSDGDGHIYLLTDLLEALEHIGALDNIKNIKEDKKSAKIKKGK